jgi:hypothetical protein
MIAKAIKGKGFRGALEYDLGKEDGRVIDTNMNGDGARELAAEFGEIRKLRPGLSKAVLHVSLSAAPGEHLTDAEWTDFGQRYLIGMGLDRNQYIVTRHADTEHEHIHLVVNRIQFDGVVTSDSHDYRRHEILMRAIERDLGLRQVTLSVDADRRAATKGEIEEGLRTGRPSTRQQLQQLCDAAAKDCSSFAQYAERLEAAGVELVPVTQLDGAKLSGLSYRLDGVMMKGSDLGKRYSPSGLVKHGVTYDKERDYEAVGRCIERGEIERAGTKDRDSTHRQDRERGAAGIDARAVGAGDGGADGRNARDTRGDRASKPGAGRTVQEPTRDSVEGIEPGISSRSRGRGEHGSSRPTDGVASLPAGDVDGDDECNARDRILALASPAHRAESSGREGSSGALAARDRSREAIERQIAAMGVERFDLLLRDATSGATVKREWSKSELLGSVAWLKRVNARGNNIYVRPNGAHGLALLDSLKDENIVSMRSNGFVPAITVELVANEFQVWVKLSERALPERVRRLAEAGLAHAFGGTGAGVVCDGYGGLAGCVNHEENAALGTRGKYVLAHSGSGEIGTRTSAYVEHVKNTLLGKNLRKNQQTQDQVLPDLLKERTRSR